MLKPRVGDVIKSYDFVGIDSCYMIGKVVAVSEYSGTLRAEFIKRVFDGAEDKKFKTDYFTAPLQGQAFFDQDDWPRIVVLA